MLSDNNEEIINQTKETLNIFLILIEENKETLEFLPIYNILLNILNTNEDTMIIETSLLWIDFLQNLNFHHFSFYLSDFLFHILPFISHKNENIRKISFGLNKKIFKFIKNLKIDENYNIIDDIYFENIKYYNNQNELIEIVNDDNDFILNNNFNNINNDKKEEEELKNINKEEELKNINKEKEVEELKNINKEENKENIKEEIINIKNIEIQENKNEGKNYENKEEIINIKNIEIKENKNEEKNYENNEKIKNYENNDEKIIKIYEINEKINFDKIVKIIIKQIDDFSTPTKKTCLLWLKILLKKIFKIVMNNYDDLIEILLNILLDVNEEVLNLNLEVLSLTASTEETFPLFIKNLLLLFNSKPILLSKSSFIIRKLSSLLDPEKIFREISFILLNTFERNNFLFYYNFIQILNNILLSSNEFSSLKNLIKNSFNDKKGKIFYFFLIKI
jgi:hypothetical protein